MEQSSSTSASSPGSDDGSSRGSSAGTEYGSDPQSESLLANDPFGNPISKLLFDAIDNLRGCGVGQDLDLPQLVIVGKQSAGKSSLLQSLTDVPFPVGDGLCTRFATRIISRRTAAGTSDSIHISIEDGDVDPFGHATNATRTSKFSPSFTSLSPEAFQVIIQQASTAMGISTTHNYSSKVLKIELSGPNRLHFGILDVPGIFLTAIRPVTDTDQIGVTQMVTAYMKKPQNIVICVADATDDLANQRIFTLAAKHVDSSRSVGVFTKCDKLDVKNANKIVEIVQKNENVGGQSFHHGWYVVQNQPKDAPSTYDRESAENAMFSKMPWNEISEKRRGISMLKDFLARLLCRRIRESFPEMQANLHKMLQSQQSRLLALGKPRPSITNQVAYLVEFAQKFHILAEKTLKSPEDLPRDEMKLRGKTQMANYEFSNNMIKYGHLYEFSSTSDGYALGVVSSEVNKLLNPEPEGLVAMNRKSKRSIPPPKAADLLYHEIRAQISRNRGEELQVMLNPSVLKPLMRMQASKWESIAKAHIKDIVAMTKEAIGHILNEVAVESTTAANTAAELQNIVLNEFTTAAEERAMEKLETWIKDNSLLLQTNNPHFAARISGAQHHRFLVALGNYVGANPVMGFIAPLIDIDKDNKEFRKKLEEQSHKWAIITPETVTSLLSEMHPRGERYMENEIHDLLEAYYKVALQDFISHVNRHIIEPFLQDPHGAIRGLSSDYITNLKEDRISELAAEEEGVKEEREYLTAKVQRLREAGEIAQTTLSKTRAVGEGRR